jgi:hypothetical protein
MSRRWIGWVVLAVIAVTGCQSRETKRRNLDALLKGGPPKRPLRSGEVALLKEVGLVERKWDVLQWCAVHYSSASAPVCQEIHHERWAAGDEQARRAFANFACVNPVDAPLFWSDQDKAVAVVLDRSQPCAGIKGLPFPKLLESLDRLDAAHVSAEPLASRIPGPAAGADCAKQAVEWLPVPATPGRAKLAQAVLRRCNGFLEHLVGEHRAVFDAYRGPIEQALAAPRRETALALVALPAELAVVERKRNAFSASLPQQMHNALRASAWEPKRWPTVGEIEVIAALVGKDAKLAAAVLDYLEKHMAFWPEPPPNIGPNAAYRQHLLRCLELSRKVAALDRSALAARLAGPPDKAFHAEIDALSRKGPDAVVAFLNEGKDNPYLGELLDGLGKNAAHPLLAVTGTSFVGEIRKKVDEALAGRMLVVSCTSAACDRVPHRVNVRYTLAYNDLCYDKYFFGYGACTNRGERRTLALSYFKDGRAAGSTTLVGETPKRVTYQRSGAIDMGPSSSDISSAADSDLRAKLAAAVLRLPY